MGEFEEIVARLRRWALRNGIRGADKLVIEVHFPDPESQHSAAQVVLAETSALYQLTQAREARHFGPVGDDGMVIQGVRVIFTNPERLDRRRPRRA